MENITEYENPRMNVDNAVAEITTDRKSVV